MSARKEPLPVIPSRVDELEAAFVAGRLPEQKSGGGGYSEARLVHGVQEARDGEACGPNVERRYRDEARAVPGLRRARGTRAMTRFAR